ncbi:MAG: helix-turn-helix domain-containing protein [Eggerthellaceae bacterium]|nr:helix-turn-helix domain-containing protein [Eggerthellaceae bacterium]
MADERLSERVEVARGRYYTTEEVMAIFHITKRTIYRWRDAGKVNPVKAGRRLLFDRTEIDALADRD